MKFKIFIPLLVLLIVFGIISYSVLNNAPKDNLEPVRFRLSWTINPGNAGEIIASELGVFEKNGLEVEIIPGGFELEPNRLVASKEATFGYPKAEEYLLAKSKGLPVMAVAAVVHKNPTGFAVWSDSNISSVCDFEGKTIGVKYGTNTEIIYNWLIAKENVSKDSIEEIPLKFDPALFLERKVDVYPGFVNNDLLYMKEEGNEINIIDSADYGNPFYGNVIIVHEDMIRDNPEVIIEFLKSLKEGWEIVYSSSPEKVEGYILDYNPSLEGGLKKGLEAYKSYIFDNSLEFGEMSRERWQSSIDELKLQGLVDSLDASEVYDDSFINQVNGV